jgi:hypothetical protein
MEKQSCKFLLISLLTLSNHFRTLPLDNHLISGCKISDTRSAYICSHRIVDKLTFTRFTNFSAASNSNAILVYSDLMLKHLYERQNLSFTWGVICCTSASISVRAVCTGAHPVCLSTIVVISICHFLSMSLKVIISVWALPECFLWNSIYRIQEPELILEHILISPFREQILDCV